MKRQPNAAQPKKGVRKPVMAQSESRTRAKAPLPFLTPLEGQGRPFLTVTTAIRAWVEANRDGEAPHEPRKKAKPAWRPQRYGDRVLVFDTETTTDAAQRLLFGFFRLYDRDRLILEGLIVGDVLDYAAMTTLTEYAARCRLPIYSRQRFVEEVFYPEIYVEGTLCVGFNLPFDLARIAVHAGICRGENRRKFRIVLSRRLRWHDMRIESLSARAALMRFVPKRKLTEWERPFFAGRFCDLSTVAAALTGKRHSLLSAGVALRARTRKMRAPELGSIDRHSLLYGRQDVRATWSLYKALRAEYVRHPFSTFENELHKPKAGRYMGELYSSASIAKQYLRLLGIRPLLERQPDFPRKYLGIAMAGYFGGRADVRVRLLGLLVRVLDFTSMYPTIFCLQELQKLLVAPRIGARVVTGEIKTLLKQMASDNPLSLLYDPRTWRNLNCFVLIEPNWATLPVRFRRDRHDRPIGRNGKRVPKPFTIAVTPLNTSEPRWYTLADIIAAMLLGATVPKIRRAIRFVPQGRSRPKMTEFRNTVELWSNRPILKILVEQKQIAKDTAGRKKVSNDHHDIAALELGLKEMANSIYGLNAEVNVKPPKDDDDIVGDVYSDIAFESPKVHDERPGAFANPILASLITGGARLMLAMLEREVTDGGGAFSFCDTDALAINCGDQQSNFVPCLTEAEIETIIARFDALSPYDPGVVPHLLKLEYPEVSNLRCFAVSAKRYVLYRWRAGNRIEIVKASESALGAIIGRSRNETTKRLARRIWLSILMKRLPVNPNQRRRAKPLIDFNMPMRRKFPISAPAILKRLSPHNNLRSYDHRIKPYGFVQSVAPTTVTGGHEPLPIAPFETDLAKSKRLHWVDYHTGEPLRLDWHGSSMAGTVPVMRLGEYIDEYGRHPEAKAADWKGNPAGPDTIGLLQRLPLQSSRLIRIGKEVDRLGGDDGATLEADRPVEYDCDELAEDIGYLAQLPQKAIAREIGMSERRWRDIAQGKTQPRDVTAARIKSVAGKRRP
jgi:hypothetical protein